MLHSGWFRLWVVAVGGICVAFSLAAGYSIWGQDACYRYVSISTKNSISDEDKSLVEHLREEADKREYCGQTQYSTLLTLEQLAKKGSVTQIGIQWLEPRGWSFSKFETLDILDSKEIQSSEILARVQKYVREARLRSFVPWSIGIVAVAIAALLLGLGIAWVRRGFVRSEGK